MVFQSIPISLSTVKNKEKETPVEIIEFILDILDNNSNEGNHYDDSNFIAELIRALGNVNIKSSLIFQKMTKTIQRYYDRDRVNYLIHL